MCGRTVLWGVAERQSRHVQGNWKESVGICLGGEGMWVV